jgi:hypothetical protein
VLSRANLHSVPVRAPLPAGLSAPVGAQPLQSLAEQKASDSQH